MRKILTIILFILSTTSMIVEANTNCMILSNGSELVRAKYQKDSLHIDSSFFNADKLKNPVWPFINESTGELFFEAHNSGKNGIYKAKLSSFSKSLELFSDGKYPSLSPTGDAVAYFDEHNTLVIKDTHSGAERVINRSVATPNIWKRPLWLSNSELIYVTKGDNIYVFNRIDDSHSMLFVDKLLPLTSKNGIVLFVDHDAKTLFKYKSGELSLIQKNWFLTMGPGVVMFDKGFLYSRQTWSKVLRLSESKSLFHYSFESGSEEKLLSDYSLFGGTLIPCDF